MNLIAFNKPYGVLSQFRENEHGTALSQFISLPSIYPAGRLDKDSEGLLLLTDHGPLNHRITQPEQKMPKSYWVQVEGEPTETALMQWCNGIILKDGLTKPAEVSMITAPKLWDRATPIRERKSIPTSWLNMTIQEGRNRQIRRMTAHLGYPTLRLIRYRIGPWFLNNLAPGTWEYRKIPKQIAIDITK